jgi:Kef-type K+ transport system membrane component KefB
VVPTLFLELTAILALVAIVSLALQWLKQPLILGYILVGFIVGPTVLGLTHSSDSIEQFGQIGVALLLFLVGLRLHPSMVRQVGSISLLTGIGQILFTTFVGFGIATLLGFAKITALYIAIAFTFSSTIVILQLLYTKNEQDTLYGRIATGFMLVQDIVAMIIFLFLGTGAPGDSYTIFGITILSKIVLVVATVYLLIKHVIPKIDKYFAESKQILFLFALAVCFVFAAGFLQLGFSLELGALLAGVLLASSPYQREIASRISTLQDFFLIMFFVLLGTHITPEVLVGNWLWVTVFSLFILIGNPIIVMLIMRPFHYTLRTSFYAGLTVAQISEFSLILLALGASLGHIPPEIIGPATLVGLITIFVSSYFMMNNERVFNKIEPALRIFFGPDRVEEVSKEELKNDAILFGCHRLGAGIVDVLESMDLDFFVVDHDPMVIRALDAGKVNSVFGAADDISFVESLPIDSTKLIISTIPQLQVNLTLLSFLRRNNHKAVFLCVAYQDGDAVELYKAGATYVIMPPYLGRRYLVDIMAENGLNLSAYEKERDRHHQDMHYTKERIEDLE